MKRKIVTTLMAAMVASTLLGTGTLTAHAADYVGQFDSQSALMISQVFDAEYYAATYPDVVAVLGDDEAALLNHYLTCGIFEGRDASATFNADAYAAANADLVAVYDTDNDVADYCSYFAHYITCGQAEGRISTVAGATAAGYTVTSVADETKTIAAPTTKATKLYSVSSSSSSSSNTSSTSVSSDSSASNTSTSETTTVSSDSSSDPNCLGNSHESDGTYQAGISNAEAAAQAAEREAFESSIKMTTD